MFVEEKERDNKYDQKFNNNYFHRIKFKSKESIISLSNSSIDDKKYEIIKDTKEYEIIKDRKEYDIIKDKKDIFLTKLYISIYISLLKKEKIEYLKNELKKYLFELKEKNINNQLDQEIIKLIKSFQNLYDKKKSYDANCDNIKSYQEEIYAIYSIMENQLKSINFQIGIKSYKYEIYVQLRDIIYKNEIIYNNILETISQKLNELKGIEKEMINITNSIINYVKEIKNDKKFKDSKFLMLCEIIENTIKIYGNDTNNIDDEIIGYFHDEIIKRMKNAKTEIINELNEIDECIGNISI
jgi:hypothetical protein